MLKTNTTLDGTPISDLKPCSEKRVELVCDSCHKITTTSFANYRRATISKVETYCKRCATKLSGIEKRGKPIRSGPRPSVWGERHASWKGGRFVASDGYVHIHLGSPRKYRKEHFLIMEECLGRPLQAREVIHHIDGDKQNNILDNLLLCANENIHRQVHNSLYFLSTTLIKAGLIKFDRLTNSYMAVDKLRELLEQPEAANQQPSTESNLCEGSTTRNLSQVDSGPTSA